MNDEEQLAASGIGRAPVLAAEPDRQAVQRLSGKAPVRPQLLPEPPFREIYWPGKHGAANPPAC